MFSQPPCRDADTLTTLGRVTSDPESVNRLGAAGPETGSAACTTEPQITLVDLTDPGTVRSRNWQDPRLLDREEDCCTSARCLCVEPA